jgi:hypothetical protein
MTCPFLRSADPIEGQVICLRMPPFLTEGGWGVESAPQSLQIIHRPLYPTRRFLHNPTGANDLSLGRPSLCRPYGIQRPPFCPDPSTGRQVSRADWGTGHLSRAPPLPRPTRLGHRFHFVIDAGDPPPPSNPPLPSRPDGGPIGGQVICGVAGVSGIESNNLNLKRPSPSASALS